MQSDYCIRIQKKSFFTGNKKVQISRTSLSKFLKYLCKFQLINIYIEIILNKHSYFSKNIFIFYQNKK